MIPAYVISDRNVYSSLYFLTESCVANRNHVVNMNEGETQQTRQVIIEFNWKYRDLVRFVS